MHQIRRLCAIWISFLLIVTLFPNVIFATGEAEDVFEGWSLTLGEDIGVNFYLKKDSAYTVHITVGGDEANYEQTETNDNTVITVRTAAAQMTDTIVFTVKDGENEVHSGEYSVRQYAQSILEGTYDQETRQMVLQMLGYGAAAQKYFNYNVENLANAGYESQISIASVPETVGSIPVTGSVDGIRLYGVSLVFESKVAMRFYFAVSGDIAEYNFSAGNPPVSKNGLYYVEIPGINPQNYEDMVTLSVSDDTDTMTVGYSPLHYIIRKCHTDTGDELKSLMQGMYGYHLQAKEYHKAVSATQIVMQDSYDMNAEGDDFTISHAALSGAIESVTVKNTEISLADAGLENNMLTVPAESFCLDDMPSGELTLVVTTDSKTVEVTGEFIWLLNSADELLAMKNHMKPGSDGITYTGHLALAADIDLTGKLMRYTGMTGTTFTGIFDGRLHTLTGLGANNTNLGLFANVGGTVKNLLLTDCYISDSAATVAGGILTGTLENIYVRGRLLRDGIGMYTDVEQYGAGLLAGRIEETAAVRNVIVEVESTGSSLKMATAFGKLMRGTTEAVFENCYTVAADGAGYLVYNSGWLKKDFASDSFETMVMLWKDTEAAALAAALGLERPAEHIVTEQSYDLNSTDAQTLTVSGIPVSAADKVTLLGVDGTEVEVTATVANGTLSITGEAMTAVQGRLATGQQKMMIYAGEEAYCVSGLELVWVIHTAEELMDMKSHLTVQADGKTVVGAVALGADIDLAGVNIRTNPMKDTYFKGVFDGRYYTVSNINVIKSASRVGILGNVYGTVRNLKVVGAAVAADSAAVVGGTLYGAVENVYVQGVITGDNMQPTTNMNNFGCGLLAGKIEHDAKIKNCIVELSEIKEDLRLATAYGKQHKLAATEGSVFFNCYAINADGCTFMTFSPKQKVSFAPDTANKNFASMWQLWQDSEAKALAQKLGISEPEKPGIAIEMADAYDMNSTDAADLVIEDTRLDGNLVSITVKGTGITLSGGVLESGRLTIPAESFQFDNMPSGNLILRVVTDQEDYDISGSFVWLVHTKAELLAMKSHLTTGDNVIYDGMIALGADITEDIILNSANAIFTTAETFAGTFDGRMHELASITANTANIGLFTNVSGTICNVKVMDALVQKNTAALVGRIFTGTMENVYVKGSVTGDGMAAASNLNNFGCGLPVARYQYGAAMNNVIVEATEIADGLRLATAFGKLGDYKTKDVIFTNCFAVGAGDAAYMNYVSGQTTADKLAFAEGTTNGNYESYTALWEDTEGYARNLAENVLKLAEPAKETVQITLEDSFDMNVSDGNFVLTDTRFTGVLSSVAVQGTQITLSGAVLADGVLTIPAESFQLEDMPSGMLTLTAETDTATYKITGDFIWVINSASELLKMKNHMTTADETIYNGMLALGADIDLSNVTIKNNGLSGKTYAGTFDGRMHTLSNMNANAGNVGLFGYVSGTVRNLKITNATVSSYTAAVVGGTLSGTLENIYVQGSITKDGMAATSKLANFGCGLLAARIQAGAKINNCIVELTSIADGLRLATAFGKMHQSSAATESSVFSNCYAIGADGCTFMKYGTWEKVSFTEGGSNKNFADMEALLADPEAAELFFNLMPNVDIADDGIEDYSVAGTTHSYKTAATENFILQNGESGYAVVISQAADKRIITAAKDFCTFFQEATGVTLPTVYAENITSFTDQSRYIVIGENTLTQSAGLQVDLSVVGAQGFQIKTVHNSVFVLGTNAGAQYGTYQLLTELFQFEYFGKDSYRLLSNVKEVPLVNYDITDVPDISIRRPNYLFLMGDSVTSDRMRLMNWGDLIIPVGGLYVHNSSKYISKTDYPDKDAWFATDGKNLCYTAHGDESEKAQMQAIVADVIITHLEENPTKTLITMTQEDTQTLCTCSACSEMMQSYNGSQAASVVIFLNGVCELVEQHFTDGETGQCEREFSILFFAYHATNKPPAVYDENRQTYVPVDEKVVCNEHLIPYFAETNADYTTNFYDAESVNLDYGENLKGWAALSEKVYFWMYSTNFKYYLTPYNTFDSTQANYKFAIENHVDFIYDQAQSNQTGTATGWSWLKMYLYSKLTWNVDQNRDALIRDFMEGFYGPAAETVKEVFRQWKLYAAYQTKVLGYSGSRSVFYEALDSALWNQRLLQQWADMLTQAMEEISYLKDSNQTLYERYLKNIATERIAYNYLLLELFQDSMTEAEISLAKEQFYHDQQLADIGLQGERTGTVADWMTEMEISDSGE